MTSIVEDPRLGPLGAAARRFITEHAGNPETSGAPALGWLSQCVDRFAQGDANASVEASFVEGAGAYLAAVLLQHFGEGAHASRDGMHRLRVGPRGFVDPFAIVQRALEAPRARPSIVADVRRAEAEAQGLEGIGRASRLFEQALGDSGSELVVTDRFDRHVYLEDISVDIGRIVDVADDQSDAAALAAAKKLVSLLPLRHGERAQVSDVSPSDARERLLPRLVGPTFEALPGLVGVPTSKETRLFLQIAYEGRSRFVRAEELAHWGLSIDEATKLALDNLARRSMKARFATVDTPHGPILYARTGDGLDAARLLLPGLPDVLGPELGLPFLAAVPHRDVLFACRADNVELRAALHARVKDDAARAPHRITDALFVVGDDGARLA